MNLVAKEYVATKQDNPGVLILSEMAGASVELSDALLINPNDTDQIEQAICRALKMPLEEQRERLQRMQAILSVQTVNKWAADFMREWRQTAEKNKRLQKKKISAQDQNEIKTLYDQAKKRLILRRNINCIQKSSGRCSSNTCITRPVTAFLFRFSESCNH